MAQSVDHGITVVEMPNGDKPVEVSTRCVAAFLGRSARGPLDRAVKITDALQFSRIFGGQWPLSSLSQSIEQFFSHGGKEAVVVRVSNGARGAELALPAPQGQLKLRAINPGQLESVRAAVDYDACDTTEGLQFNLTVQRTTVNGSRVVDQEIHRCVSVDPEDADYVVQRLLDSELVRVFGSVPERAPLGTGESASIGARGYVVSHVAGTDGDEVCDYDLIGSSERATGLHALQELDQLDLIYAPPEISMSQHGPVFIAAATAFAARHGAMLICDPPAGALTKLCSDALREAHGENLLSYYPRPVFRNRPGECLVVGGALAGLLAKATGEGRPGAGFGEARRSLSRNLVLPQGADSQSHAAQRFGMNTLAPQVDGRLDLASSITMACGVYDDVAQLATARLKHHMQRALARATRWAIFSEGGPSTWLQIAQQISDYLGELERYQRIEPQNSATPWFVQCDRLTNANSDANEREVHFLFGFTPIGTASPMVLSATQSVRGFSMTRAAFVFENRANA